MAKWPLASLVVESGGAEGIRTKLSWDDYCDLPGLNPSTIAHGINSPGQPGSLKHLKHAWEDPDRKDSDTMLWGRALHCLLFEPKEFEHRYISWADNDDGSTRRRAGKAWDELTAKATALDLQILTKKQWDSALAAAKSFVAEPLVQKLISSGQGEVTLLAVEEGLQCRGRVDWIATGLALVDLKSTRNIDARAFGRDFYKFRYDVKLGLYRRWLNRLTSEVWPVSVICQENAPPYDVTVVPIPDAVLDRGAEKGLEVIRQVKEAIATDHWPGMSGGNEYFLDVPYSEMADEELTGCELAV